MPTVKCRDCGLLAVRDHYDSSVNEADERVRESGLHKSSTGRATVAGVFCYGGKREFTQEELGGQNAVVDAINREIDCDAFMVWRRGKSAKEHEEMNLLAEVERRTQAAEERATREAERRHQENLKVSERSVEAAEEAVSASKISADAAESSAKAARHANTIAIIALVASVILGGISIYVATFIRD